MNGNNTNKNSETNENSIEEDNNVDSSNNEKEEDNTKENGLTNSEKKEVKKYLSSVYEVSEDNITIE